MAKSIKKEVKKKDSSAPDGSASRPFPWVPPFPASVIDEDDGKTETVFVACTVNQMVGVNGQYIHPGPAVLPCNFAHTHAAAIGAPQAPAPKDEE